MTIASSIRGLNTFVFSADHPFELVSEGTSCRDAYKFKGETSLEVCASTCRAISTMFSHAFTAGKCSSELCDCYCITGAKEDGTCTQYSNTNYKLYKYSDPKIPSTPGEKYFDMLTLPTMGISKQTQIPERGR